MEGCLARALPFLDHCLVERCCSPRAHTVHVPVAAPPDRCLRTRAFEGYGHTCGIALMASFGPTLPLPRPFPLQPGWGQLPLFGVLPPQAAICDRYAGYSSTLEPWVASHARVCITARESTARSPQLAAASTERARQPGASSTPQLLPRGFAKRVRRCMRCDQRQPARTMPFRVVG